MNNKIILILVLILLSFSVMGQSNRIQGLYWTDEVSVKTYGDSYVKLSTGLSSCNNLLQMLEASEWRLTKQSVVGDMMLIAEITQDEQTALVYLYESGNQYATWKIMYEESGQKPVGWWDHETMVPFSGEGCSGNILILPLKMIEATGVEKAQGQAKQLADCTIGKNGSIDVGLMYEGPDNFRASIDFTVPKK